MKSVLGIVLLFFVSLAEAQQISVQSFRKLENDLSARGSEGRTDQNGDRCAIIKVVTPGTDFVFEPDALGTMGTVQKTGEIWLYVPYGAKHLTIKHLDLGILRNYAYPERIEKACVYEMILTTGRVKTVVEEDVGGQWLVIMAEPQEAMVYIDEIYEAGEAGRVQKFLPLGRHTYRVDCALYHPEAGQVELSAENKQELSVRLRPAFGYVEINSEPETGARVWIDGEEVGRTPYRSERLKSGEHSVEVVKAMYAPIRQTIKVTDGETLPLRLNLSANYGLLTVTTDREAEIWINDEKKEQGRWNGRLTAGMYVVEARRPSHRVVRQSIEIKAGENRELTIGSPEPIYGTLNINSNPGGADILLNGESCGTTPQIVRQVLIGENRVELIKPGYEKITRFCTVEEGKVSALDLTLSPESAKVWNEADIDFSGVPSYTSRTNPLIVGQQAYVLFVQRECSPSYTASIFAKDEAQSRVSGRTINKYYHFKAHKETVSVRGFYRYDFPSKKWIACALPPYAARTVEVSENIKFPLGESRVDWGLAAMGNAIFTLGQDYIYQPGLDKWAPVPVVWRWTTKYWFQHKIVFSSSEKNGYSVSVYDPEENRSELVLTIPAKKGYFAHFAVEEGKMYFVVGPANKKKINTVQVYFIHVGKKKAEQIKGVDDAFYKKLMESSADPYKIELKTSNL